MSISETYLYTPPETVDTSNFAKHTNPNPLQQLLIVCIALLLALITITRHIRSLVIRVKDLLALDPASELFIPLRHLSDTSKCILIPSRATSRLDALGPLALAMLGAHALFSPAAVVVLALFF